MVLYPGLRHLQKKVGDGETLVQPGLPHHSLQFALPALNEVVDEGESFRLHETDVPGNSFLNCSQIPLLHVPQDSCKMFVQTLQFAHLLLKDERMRFSPHFSLHNSPLHALVGSDRSPAPLVGSKRPAFLSFEGDELHAASDDWFGLDGLAGGTRGCHFGLLGVEVGGELVSFKIGEDCAGGDELLGAVDCLGVDGVAGRGLGPGTYNVDSAFKFSESDGLNLASHALAGAFADSHSYIYIGEGRGEGRRGVFYIIIKMKGEAYRVEDMEYM